MKKWKKLCHLIAVVLSIAVIITEVLQVPIISYAAGENVTGEFAVSGGDGAEPVATDVSGGDVVAPTVSGGDSAWEIEEYQSKKLKISAVKTTVFTGESNVIAAKIGYESTTSDEGYGYRVSEISMNGLNLTYYSDITCDTSNPEELKVSVYDGAAPGKYIITLLPIVPAGIHAEPATLTINVVLSINSIRMDTRNMVVYKATGKSATLQLKPLVKAYREGYTAYKPGALKWSALYYDSVAGDYVPYEGKDITIGSAGKVTIGKNWDGEKYPKLKIVCQANDYEGNTASDYCIVELYHSFPADGTAVIVSSADNYAFQNGDEVTAASLQGTYFCVSTKPFVKGEKATVLDSRLYTYKSNSKDVFIDKDGRITVASVSGKPVTLTATSLDGKNKKSLTLNLKKKIVAMDELEIGVTGLLSLGGRRTIKNTPDYTFQYTGNGNDIIRLDFETASGKDYYDMKVSVKGGKNVTSNCYKLVTAQMELEGYTKQVTDTQDVYIIPTAPVVEVTIKSGAESRVYKIIDVNYTTKKNTPLKGEPKITTGAELYTIDDMQTIRLYVGKQNAGGSVQMSLDKSFYMANYGNTLADEAFRRRCINTTLHQIDEDGYVEFTVRGFGFQYKSAESAAKPYKGIKFPNALKYQLTVCDKDGNYYTPSPLTVKIINSMPKTDYKLQTSYKITRQRMMLQLQYTEWDSQSDYCYYQQLTYSGSREPEDTIQFVDFDMELGKDLLGESDLAKKLDICKDAHDNYYLCVNDYWAYEMLKEANSKIIAEGKDVTKYGKDAKLDGYIYITYKITTKEGYVIPKKDKVKVSIVIPKNDWERLRS